MRDLQYYASSAKEAITNDNARDDTFGKIHDAYRSIFENPPELKALPWIQDRRFVSTAPADAINAAIRTYATRSPDLQIQPLSDDPDEYARTEFLEEAMKWELIRMNRMGRKSPHWKIVESAMLYCAVAIETSYLPFFYKGAEKNARVKEILRSRNFRWRVHTPTHIHTRESDDILESVVNAAVYTAQELIDLFGTDNEGIREMVKSHNLEDPHALNTALFTLYDYTDWDARVKWISHNSGSPSVNREAPVGIELMRKERTVSFLPWVFVDNEEPLLRQMIDADLWQNVNILRTMQFSKAVDMAAHPEYWIQTPDGTLRGVHIDNQNPNQPLVTGPGSNVTQLRPPMLDPQLATLAGMAESEVFRTTVAQILASVEKYAGTQNFSVVNAMLNAAMAQLALSQMAAERAETLAVEQNFRWIKESGIPMLAFRSRTKGEKQQRGQELWIEPGEFDLDYLYLSVKLRADTVMDKQTEITNAINKVERLGMSRRMAWDELGMENYELSEAQKGEEDLVGAHIQAKMKEILMRPDLQAQQAMQQQQQAQQQGAEGFANRGNTTSTQPGQGREQITGQSASGQEIA